MAAGLSYAAKLHKHFSAEQYRGQCQWRSDETYQRECPSGFNAFAENIGFEI